MKVETHVDGELARRDRKSHRQAAFGARRTLETTSSSTRPGRTPRWSRVCSCPAATAITISTASSAYLASLGEADVDLQGVSEGFLATERPDWSCRWTGRDVGRAAARGRARRAARCRRAGDAGRAWRRLAFTCRYDVAAPEAGRRSLVEVEYSARTPSRSAVTRSRTSHRISRGWCSPYSASSAWTTRAWTCSAARWRMT